VCVCVLFAVFDGEKIEVGGLVWKERKEKRGETLEKCTFLTYVVTLCGGGFINGSLATFHLKMTRRCAAI
jgi:hypothetical protein